MAKIHLLPDPLVSQIAAGEVVERPASVVKELVENALDAGAAQVEVLLEAGGKGRVAVVDDGSGMAGDDTLLAFDRHATSKIGSFSDLESVATLGFRGEALAAIASVARVELTTAERAGDGHRVLIEGGRVRVAEPFARPRGTTLDVRSLFFNVPARRKFLKTPESELRRCLEVVQGYALARPDVRWRVLHDDRTLLDLLPVGAAGPRQRIAQLFGAELASRLVALPEAAPAGGAATGAGGGIDDAGAGQESALAALPQSGSAASLNSGFGASLNSAVGAGGSERISGWVGTPQTVRGRRQFVFVNRRLVRDRAVLAVFYRAVRDEWRSDEYPALFLMLDVPPEEVDVNVHPQKAEVRFRDPRLLERVTGALHAGLALARGEEAAPLRRPAAAPDVPFAWQGLGGPPPLGPGPGLARRYGPNARFGQEPWLPAAGAAGSVAAPTTPWDASGAGAAGGSPGAPSLAGEPAATRRWDAGGQPALQGGVERLAGANYAPIERAAVPLSGRSGEVRPFRLLGQYKGTLILLEGPDGLYLIDQHVAHERVLYERLRRSLAAATPPSQQLLTPLLLDLSPAERLGLVELVPRLEACGFALAELSGQTLALQAVPAVLSAAEAEALLVALAGEGGGATADLGPRVLDALAASLACKAAVKMHHPLAPQEMEALVAELFAAEQPYACPHGRPIVLQMTDSDLERRFGRR
jgi:DNA mismatch repair protein MutL